MVLAAASETMTRSKWIFSTYKERKKSGKCALNVVFICHRGPSVKFSLEAAKIVNNQGKRERERQKEREKERKQEERTKEGQND